VSENPAIPPAETILASKSLEQEEIDPELLELPDPPRGERSFILATLLLTAFASLAMSVALRHDAKYAFASDVPDEIGELASAPASKFEENHHVHGRAVLGGASALRFERPFRSETYRVAPVVGHTDIWAEVVVPAGDESGRFVPPTEFTGRLVRFDAAGPKHRGLASGIENATGQKVAGSAWLIVDGESPASAKWAVALMVMFAAFAAWNVLSAVKLFKRVK
jgi:hypothetical protein